MGPGGAQGGGRRGEETTKVDARAVPRALAVGRLRLRREGRGRARPGRERRRHRHELSGSLNNGCRQEGARPGARRGHVCGCRGPGHARAARDRRKGARGDSGQVSGAAQPAARAAAAAAAAGRLVVVVVGRGPGADGRRRAAARAGAGPDDPPAVFRCRKGPGRRRRVDREGVVQGAGTALRDAAAPRTRRDGRRAAARRGRTRATRVRDGHLAPNAPG